MRLYNYMLVANRKNDKEYEHNCMVSGVISASVLCACTLVRAVIVLVISPQR